MGFHEVGTLNRFGKKLKNGIIFCGRLKNLSFSHFNKLENIIIVTTAPEFDLNVDHCDALRSVTVAGVSSADKGKDHVRCKISSCKNLQTLNIVANEAPAIVDLSNCPDIREAFFTCGKRSEISGLADCTRINYLILPPHEKLLMDISRETLLKNIEASN